MILQIYLNAIDPIPGMMIVFLQIYLSIVNIYFNEKIK